MGTKKIILMCAVSSIFFGGILLNVNAGKSSTGQQQSSRQGPPPEAYTACEGKNAGDTAEFKNPQGGTVTGKCEQEGDRLVLRPDRPKGSQGGGRQGPPPEAYTACEGKNAGDTAEFKNPQGGTVTGKCEQQGDRLVLRPDRPKGNPGSRQKNN